jgi:uncharacterized protein (TIGR02145 family)
MKTIMTMLLLMLALAGFSQETIIIGQQEWMKYNLNVGTMVQGTATQTDNGTVEKYCYQNLESNCNTYGGLYQWNEAMQYATAEGSQGICPDGFHIPTNAEWNVLLEYLGGIYSAGGKIKETGTAHWKGMRPARPLNIDATNESEFTALPGGIRWHSGAFYYIQVDGNFWTSSEVNGTTAYYGGAMYSTKNATNGQFYKPESLSVRCLKN